MNAYNIMVTDDHHHIKYIGVQSWKAAYLSTLEIRVEQKGNRVKKERKMGRKKKKNQCCRDRESNTGPVDNWPKSKYLFWQIRSTWRYSLDTDLTKLRSKIVCSTGNQADKLAEVMTSNAFFILLAKLWIALVASSDTIDTSYWPAALE